jgi:hypothetical protein
MKNPMRMFENSQVSIIQGDKSELNMLGHSMISDLISHSPSPRAGVKLPKHVSQNAMINFSRTLDPGEAQRILQHAKLQGAAFQTI